MISDPYELEELRNTTIDLISEEPTSIALVRETWERTPSGGVRPVEPQNLPAVNRWFGATSGDPRYVTNESGEQVVATHVLIGTYDDDMKEKDTFTLGNRTFRIVEIAPDRSWELRAWVVERA